jgi:hypothetical protein
MELTTTALNKFLQATDSAKSFSFGSSAQFRNQTFADIVRSNWATRLVVLSLEKRILRRLESARKAIGSFILYAESPTQWYSRAPSPTFTNSTDFARSVVNATEGNSLSNQTGVKPVTNTEDSLWELQMTQNIDASIAELSAPETELNRPPSRLTIQSQRLTNWPNEKRTRPAPQPITFQVQSSQPAA